MTQETSKVRALRHSLLDPDEVEAAMNVVAMTPEITPERLARVRQQYLDRCEDICAALDDLTFEGDESEAEKHIPLTWLATRYEWSRLNDQMQYQTILKGQADPMTMAQGSMLSKIAEKLEALQTRQELFWTLKLAADPFGTVGRIPMMSRRLMRITASAGRGAGEVLQEFHAMREYLANHIADRDVLDTLDKALSRSIESVERGVGIELSDLHAALEAEVVERLAGSGVTALLELENRDGTELIPPEVSEHVFLLVCAWLDALFTTSVEASPEAREANGKSAHLTMSWRLDRTDRKLSFVLRDDGMGTAQFPVGRNDLPPGLLAHCTNEPGLGSRLVIESDFLLNGNAEYLSFSVFNGSGSSALAIPAHFVRFIELVDPVRLASASNLLSTSDGDYYPILDTSKAVFGANGGEDQNLVVFADLGDGGKLALRAGAIHGIARGRIKPLPFLSGDRRVAGVINNGGELVIVLDIEGILSS